MPTPATRLGRVARVNEHERDAALVALVGEVGGELPESPIAVRATLRPLNVSGPRPDAFEILAPDGAPRGAGMVGYPLCDGVGHIGLKPPFSLGATLEQAWRDA